MTFLTIQVESNHPEIQSLIEDACARLAAQVDETPHTVVLDVFDSPNHVVSQWGNG